MRNKAKLIGCALQPKDDGNPSCCRRGCHEVCCPRRWGPHRPSEEHNMKQPLRSPGFPLCSKVIGVYEVEMKRETTETCFCLACPHLFFKIRYEQESNAYKDIWVESPYEHMHPEVWIWRPYHVWFSNLVYLFSLPTTPLGKILTASSSPVCRWVHSVTNTSCAKKNLR